MSGGVAVEWLDLFRGRLTEGPEPERRDPDLFGDATRLNESGEGFLTIGKGNCLSECSTCLPTAAASFSFFMLIVICASRRNLLSR